MSQPAFDAYVAANLPGIYAFNGQAPGVVVLVDPVIGQMEAARVDYHQAALSDSQVALAATFANANRIPLRPIPWLFIVSGIVLALLVHRRGRGVAHQPGWRVGGAVNGLTGQRNPQRRQRSRGRPLGRDSVP